jgi:hypothetical protein
MDGGRFDAMVRRLADQGSGGTRSRRAALRGAAAALLAAATAGKVGGGIAGASHCTYVGCGCATGTYHPCDDGLVCCPSSPGTPGGAGVCESPGDCNSACNGSGYYCGDSCNWGDTCPSCCSGYCGSTGACA